MKYNFCKNCGSPVQPGMPNCQRCGAAVDQVQPVDENKPMAQPPGMLKQYYDNNAANTQPVNNMQQSVGNPMPQQQPMGTPMNNVQPMGTPVGQPTGMPQMNQPVGQPMGGQSMNGTVPVQPQAGKDNSLLMGIGSIGFALISFFLFGWACLAGIGLGFSGMSQAKAANNGGGKAVNIIGLVLNFIDLVLMILYVAGVTINLFN